MQTFWLNDFLEDFNYSKPIEYSIIKDKNLIDNTFNTNKGIIQKVVIDNKVIGIFPEGTINRTEDIIMPFKYGAVKMSKETNKLLVPFAINNKYPTNLNAVLTFSSLHSVKIFILSTFSFSRSISLFCSKIKS